MKLKIHNRYYNWDHVREIYPSAKWSEGSYCPEIIIRYSNGEQTSFVFDEEAHKGEYTKVQQEAQNILNKAIAEMEMA